MMARADQLDRPTSMLVAPGHRQPLLHLVEPDVGANGQRIEDGLPTRPTDRMTKSQSVFGVDKIWEREMAKLKVIQEREAIIAAEQAAKEELEAAKREAKEAKKNKKKKKPVESPILDAQEDAGLLAGQEPDSGISPITRMADLPPQLSYSPEKAVKPVAEPETVAEVLTDDRSIPSEPAEDELDASESDSDSDSEEDVPLSHFARAKSVSLKDAPEDSDSDSEEDVPLSKLRSPARTAPATALSMIPADFGTGSLGLDVQPPNDENHNDDEEEEDDVPLALRKNAPASVEDDLPLGYKHAGAAQRQYAESSRASMVSPQMSRAGDMGAPHVGPPWGYHDHQANAMMSPYQSVYGMPAMSMGYMSPAMSGMGGMGPMGGMGGMAWPGQMMPGMPVPGMTLTMPGVGMPMMNADGGPMPPQATKNIDDWRKEVAIQPVPTGSSSARG